MKRYEIWGEYGYETIQEVADDGDWVLYEDVKAAIDEAVAAEREACARACEAEFVGTSIEPCGNVSDDGYNTALRHGADAIRARSKP